MLRNRLDVSERWACRVVGQHCSTQRYEPKLAEDDRALRSRLREISAERPRWGYRRAHHRLIGVGIGLPARPDRRRCAQAAERGRRVHARGARDAGRAQHRCRHDGEVFERLATERGAPEYLRMDNGPELTAHALKDRCPFSEAGTAYIDPGVRRPPNVGNHIALEGDRV
jgi:putative transposase